MGTGMELVIKIFKINNENSIVRQILKQND